MISKLTKNEVRRNSRGQTRKRRLTTNPASNIQSLQKPTSAPDLDSLYGMIESGSLGVYKIMPEVKAESKRENATTSEVVPWAETERRAIINALHETRGNKVAASRILRIGRTTLYRKLKKYIQTENPRRETAVDRATGS